MASRSDRILLVGSGGFTGRPLAERLRSDGHEVIGLTRNSGEAGEFSGDLCDADWVRRVVADTRPTAALHLAGITTALHADVGEVYSVNVVGTVNLLAALAALPSGPRLVVIASSATVYAAPRGEEPVDEESPLAPNTHYAVSKRTVEDIGRLYQDRLPIVITRPFNYTGPGQTTTFLVPKIVDHFVRKASEIELGNLDLFRDISDVERVVEVYARIVSSAIEPMTVNVCSGRTILLRDIISLMQDISGHRIKLVQNPSLMRDNEARTIRGSTARLERLLGCLPNPDFGATLRRMYQAGRSQR